MNQKKISISEFSYTAHGYADQGLEHVDRRLERQEQIAALLVERGWAVRKPLRQHRCWKSIELKAINDLCGNIYVTETGKILVGYTQREAHRVGSNLRRRMLGEDDAED